MPIGVQYTHPKFKKGILVESTQAYERQKYGIGVILKRQRFKGRDLHLYTIYWTKTKTKSKFSEPMLRQVRRNKQNGKQYN